MADIPAGHDIDLTISIVNWNTREDLLACLRSFIPDLNSREPAGSIFVVDGFSCEVIVVDNFSEDNSAEAVSANYPIARILAQTSNLGFGTAHNKAFALSRGRYILVLNPDSLVQPGSIGQLVRFADNHPEAGIVGPKILNLDGSIQYSARKFPTLAAGLYRNSFLGKLFPNHPAMRNYLQSDWDHSDSREADWVSGAAMLIRRSTLLEMGGFEEEYFMYVEDVDICWRARQSAWTVWFCADSTVVHIKARASDLAPNRMIYHHHRSMYIFFKRYYRSRSSMLDRIIVPVGLAVRASYFIGKNRYIRWRRKRKIQS